MRAVIQRVSSASVTIDGNQISTIQGGLMILLGITHADSEESALYLAKRCLDLRIFEDAEGKMNLSVKEVGGELLVVSQFTLYGDTRKGNRPSFVDAAPPQIAEPLYEFFVGQLRSAYVQEKVKTGVFRAMMDVALVNQGPVTVTIESKESGQ